MSNVCYAYKIQHGLNEFSKFNMLTIHVKDEFLNNIIDLIKTNKNTFLIEDILKFPDFNQTIGKKIDFPMNILIPEDSYYGNGIAISKDGLYIVFGHNYLEFSEFTNLIVDHFIQIHIYELEKKINEYIEKYDINLNIIYEIENGDKAINEKIGDLLYKFPSTMLVDWNGKKHYIPSTSNTLTIYSKNEQILMAMGINPNQHYSRAEIIQAVESTFELIEKLNCMVDLKEMAIAKQVLKLYKKYVTDYKNSLFNFDTNMILQIKIINDENIYMSGFIYQDKYLYRTNMDSSYEIKMNENNYIYPVHFSNNNLLNDIITNVELSNKWYIKSRLEFEKKLKIKN